MWGGDIARITYRTFGGATFLLPPLSLLLVTLSHLALEAIDLRISGGNGMGGQCAAGGGGWDEGEVVGAAPGEYRMLSCTCARPSPLALGHVPPSFAKRLLNVAASPLHD